MKLFYSFILILLTANISTFAQLKVAQDAYWLYFSNKNNSAYSTDKPQEFLSEKAIERRRKNNLNITEQDLPVNQTYIDSLKKMGLKIHQTSKWFNAVCVITKNKALIDTITNISFIVNRIPDCPQENIMNTEFDDKNDLIQDKNNNTEKKVLQLNYGEAEKQITTVNGHVLHNEGYLGQDIDVAVLDAGFLKVNTLSSYKYLWENNKIKGAYDFVNNDTLKYNTSSHGAKVLAILGGNLPGELMGSAPEANYWLYRTENANSEQKIEEINWIAAAEKADSAGIDIITTSLGYNTFDDKTSNYTYEDLNGCTALISITADIATNKGILVVCSAGNENGPTEPWKYITAPGDAKNVLTVGAILSDSTIARFSSVGPTADGRVKPNVVALGYKSATQGSDGQITTASGTSYACPLIAGLAACLWQAFPEFNNLQLLRAIEGSSSSYMTPDSIYGYGIPDFKIAMTRPDTAQTPTVDHQNIVNAYPVPFNNHLIVEVYSEENQTIKIDIIDPTGRLHKSTQTKTEKRSYNKIKIEEFSGMQTGIYLLKITGNGFLHTKKLLKN